MGIVELLLVAAGILAFRISLPKIIKFLQDDEDFIDYQR